MSEKATLIEVEVAPALGDLTVEYLQRTINGIISGDITDIAIATCERGGTKTYFEAPINPDRLIGITRVLEKRMLDDWEDDEEAGIGDAS